MAALCEQVGKENPKIKKEMIKVRRSFVGALQATMGISGTLLRSTLKKNIRIQDRKLKRQ
jgi:hypothetical protein